MKPLGGKLGVSSWLMAAAYSSVDEISEAYKDPMYCMIGKRLFKDSGSERSRLRKWYCGKRYGWALWKKLIGVSTFSAEGVVGFLLIVQV